MRTEDRTRAARGLLGHQSGIRKLYDFFAANPGEELTAVDAAAKISVSVRTAETYLSHLAGEGGKLERVSIYRVKAAE